MTAQETITKLIKKYEAKISEIDAMINPSTGCQLVTLVSRRDNYRDFISDLKQLQQNTL